MHVQRLEHLIQTLREVKVRDEAQGHSHFYMGDWANKNTIDCETVCCALGWECTTPEAQAQGLFLSVGYTEYGYGVGDIPKHHYGFSAGARYFDISLDASEMLFAPYHYTGDRHIAADITIDQVIGRIECLLKHGEEELHLYVERALEAYRLSQLPKETNS